MVEITTLAHTKKKKIATHMVAVATSMALVMAETAMNTTMNSVITSMMAIMIKELTKSGSFGEESAWDHW